MSKRNKPLAAQQPPPAFANDPGGYWAAILAQNAVAGISSVLPVGTVIQSDVAAKGRLLYGQINWVPAFASWNGCNLKISLSDAQFLLALQEGGGEQQGRITILVEKSQFPLGTAFDSLYGSTFKIQAGNNWHEFMVAEMIGQFDDSDPGLTLFLENNQDDIGN